MPTALISDAPPRTAPENAPGVGAGRYDVVVVGSSPISLCMALHHARAGRSVCVIERDDRLGGAWATEDCLGLPAVETSPHIIMPDADANALLADMFPGMFAAVADEAQEVFMSRHLGMIRLPLRRCLSVSLVRNYVRWIESGDRSWPVRLAMFAVASLHGGVSRWSRNRCPSIYPVEGLQGWIAAIRRALQAHGSRILESRAVVGLEIVSGTGAPSVRATLAGGGEIRAREACVTRALQVEAMTVNGAAVPMAYEGRHSQHLTLLVQGDGARGFWSLYGDDWFEMINDVTAYASPRGGKPARNRVVTARLNSRRLYRESEFAGYLERLEQVGYLAPGAVVLDHVVRNRHQRRMCAATATRITRLAGSACTILDAGELGLDIAIRRYFGETARPDRRPAAGR